MSNITKNDITDMKMKRICQNSFIQQIICDAYV